MDKRKREGEWEKYERKNIGNILMGNYNWIRFNSYI